MFKAINTAATGMSAQEINVNTLANNIANVNTTGFKKGRTEFQDLLYETLQEPGAKYSTDTQYNVGTQIGSGSKVSAVRKINTQGSPQITRNPFDLMINGDGFFGILTPSNEIKYTRDGSFNVDHLGNLVNSDGLRVYPGINIPPGTTSVNISSTGEVEAYLPGQVNPTGVGSIAVFTFANPAGLRSEGKNLVAQTTSSGVPLQNIPGQSNSGVIEQGHLESSNVNVMNEMTELIRAQRAYESNAKVMNVVDGMMGNTNNIVGR